MEGLNVRLMSDKRKVSIYRRSGTRIRCQTDLKASHKVKNLAIHVQCNNERKRFHAAYNYVPQRVSTGQHRYKTQKRVDACQQLKRYPR